MTASPLMAPASGPCCPPVGLSPRSFLRPLDGMPMPAPVTSGSRGLAASALPRGAVRVRAALESRSGFSPVMAPRLSLRSLELCDEVSSVRLLTVESSDTSDSFESLICSRSLLFPSDRLRSSVGECEYPATAPHQNISHCDFSSREKSQVSYRRRPVP
jgi:hypothetical protein